MWDTLGLDGPAGESAIRKAYAARLRVWRPDTHPLEFSQLREAYEAALDWARREASSPPPAQVDAAGAELEFADTQPADEGLSSATPTPTPEAERPYAAAQALIAQLARDFSESGEAAGVDTLHRQFEAVSQGTVDARLEWETVLLHSLLTADTPPPALLFEADRLLRWTPRLPELARTFGDNAVQRLRLLLDMACECIYARHFSPNRWHARLFGAAPARWFGATATVAGAAQTAEYWRGLCQAAGLEKMLQYLDARCLRRISGRMLLSCDVLFAAVLALWAWVLVQDYYAAQRQSVLVFAGWTAAAFLLALPLPLLGRWTWRSPAMTRFRGWWSWLANVPKVVTLIVVPILFVAALVAAMGENPLPVRVAGLSVIGVAFAGAAIAVGIALWRVLRWCERVACLPWLWVLRVWGNLRFKHVVEQLGAPPTLAQQLRNLPLAARRSWTDARARRLQARQRAAAAPKPAASGGSVNWWWIIVFIAVMNALARLGR